jgi:hypothetical protein
LLPFLSSHRRATELLTHFRRLAIAALRKTPISAKATAARTGVLPSHITSFIRQNYNAKMQMYSHIMISVDSLTGFASFHSGRRRRAAASTPARFSAFHDL